MTSFRTVWTVLENVVEAPVSARGRPRAEVEVEAREWLARVGLSDDLRYVELAETVHVSYWKFIRHVFLPGALPGFLLGLRFAVMAAWLGLVVVEQFNATSGIGYMINLARSYAQSDIMLVGLVVYGLLGVTSDFAVRALERRVLRWRRTLAK